MGINDISRAIQRKNDEKWRVMANDQSPVIVEAPSGVVYVSDPSVYTQAIAQGKNITISTAGNIQTINAVMGLLEGSNISISTPDDDGKVTITGTINGKEISIADFTGKDGFVLTYNATLQVFELAEVASSYDLPQATETVLGGIKAKAKTTEASEVAIDTTTGKLYAPSGGSVSADNVSIADTGGNFTAEDVEGALSELFSAVSDGKTLIAAAITDKGVSTSATDTFGTMATNIGNISGGSAPSEIRYKSHVLPVYTAGATSVSLTIPSDTVEGDLLIVCLFARSAVTAPSGWTQAIKQTVYTANVQWLEVYYKIASSSDAGSTLTFTQATSARMAVSLIVAICPSSGMAIDDFAGANSTGQAAIPSVTSEGSGRLCLIAHSSYYSVTSGSSNYYVIGNKWQIINDPYFELSRLAISICHMGSGARPSATLKANTTYNTDTASIAVIFAPT
jgi:hypothetical protein